MKKFFVKLTPKYVTRKSIHYTLYIIRDTQVSRSLAIATILTLLITPLSIFANETLTSPNYRLEPNAANSFGGLSETGSYQLVDSGGEAVLGLGSSGSYKLDSGYVAQLQQSIELNVLPKGLAAYYPLNTGTGIQAYDVTSNNNQGVLESGPSWSGGQVGGGALSFDGTDDHVDIASFDTPSTSELTMSAWVYQASGNESQRVVYNGSGTNAHGFTPNDTGTFRFAVNDGSGFQSVGTTETLNEWVHYVGVFDNGSLRLYKDGEEVDSATVAATISSYSGLALGSDVGGGVNFEGQLDEVKIYDRALNGDEVLDEYVASSQGISSALTLPRIAASSSQTVGAEAIVLTDAPGYDLGLAQDGNLRTGDGDEIPSISSTIEFPDPWSEGSTTGFGFSVTDAVQRDGKWGSDPDYEYAAIPNNTTTFHSRTGLTGGVKELAELQFRLGVEGDQTAGVYSNRLGFTATMKP